MIIIIGAGHAGVEAAMAAARVGCDVMLFTLSLDAVANMPCNPSIGGSGKGHLVYETDALGGVMGRAADLCTLQSRTLNESRGSAVRSKRVQADRAKYHRTVLSMLQNEPKIKLCQGEIVAIETERGRVTAVKTRLGARVECSAVVIATGTYLSGHVHVGDINYPAGPDGSLPASMLSESLRGLGVPLMRFKTGTPVRVSARTVDFSEMEVQYGEEHPVPFSYYTDEDYMDGVEQMPCHIVYTNADTHRVILDNLTRSAMYSGNIHGRGPRYCPSIEDKLVRFADKERHQLFVEPMGEGSDELYIGGFSTSMPVDVQYAMLRTLPGFANAHITRHAYAIEYDCLDPLSLTATLSVRGIEGLYSAGQSTFDAIWNGSRISISLAFICAAINMTIGVIIGSIWGFSKKVDMVMNEVYNILTNIPYLVFIAVMVMLFSASFWTMVLALTATGWVGIAYFIRTQVVIIRDREYNLASKCLGTSTFKIAMKNILPFMTSVIVTLLATEIPSYISYEVFLAYIGMGLSEMSLGRLIFEAESAMVTPGWQFEFWSPVAIASIITVVLYVVGQNLGDASDPRTHM